MNFIRALSRSLPLQLSLLLPLTSLELVNGGLCLLPLSLFPPERLRGLGVGFLRRVESLLRLRRLQDARRSERDETKGDNFTFSSERDETKGDNFTFSSERHETKGDNHFRL